MRSRARRNQTKTPTRVDFLRPRNTPENTDPGCASTDHGEKETVRKRDGASGEGERPRLLLPVESFMANAL